MQVLAAAADAEAIVAGNEDLLILGDCRGIPILKPRLFLEGLQGK
jgi:predicted nucleic acid-binding protein